MLKLKEKYNSLGKACRDSATNRALSQQRLHASEFKPLVPHGIWASHLVPQTRLCLPQTSCLYPIIIHAIYTTTGQAYYDTSIGNASNNDKVMQQHELSYPAKLKRNATPLRHQWSCGRSDGIMRSMTKLVEWPVVAKTPRRSGVQYKGHS